ncbi:DUF2066 domain-containing protein [Ensifer adhaerens]|uniref:DUF2066 domain-containing protein n=1 Tax=Ensifer adhaerens TaxID=106592 RepID=UPI001CC0F44C|nr:DUF2066 domain-containing protein [Ensifer adhaerens]MBZ7922637.1 DUF2066 domain-containing protein [Ensifer adhaerens]UAX91254.1 DUF2066 domain-containing protein [Ensifer adhaerens]UAX98882.1 DUF2066 domain-containing protein [Ensifer adhaerens]UAY06265.1 DUF2066 domain-containing protein [Ensifer adhaerens]
MTTSRMLLTFLFAAGLGAAACAGDIERLYQSDAIVTGTGEVNRQIGFRECLGEVLVKVSGDPTIPKAPGFAALEAEAGSFVASFSYRDRLEGIPIHDEQGTHDRPHDLTCLYAPATLDPLLAKLGRKPWLEPRPVIAVLLAVEDQRRRFVLARDGDESPYMADSLQASATPLALSVTLPDKAAIAGQELDFVTISQAGQDTLSRVARLSEGDVTLAGTLVWSDQARGWIANWRMASSGKDYAWKISGVSFDDAFRNALRGAARILSGNGSP